MPIHHLFKRRQVLLLGGTGAVSFLGGAVAVGVIDSQAARLAQTTAVDLIDSHSSTADSGGPYLNPGTFDQRFLAKQADVKQIWDFTDIEQIQLDGLTAIKNAMNDFQFVYQKVLYPVIDLRGQTVVYALDDVMWMKYHLGTLTGQNTLEKNPLYHRFTSDNGTLNNEDPRSIYQDHSLQALMQRGVQIAVCHQALKGLASQHGSNAQSVFNEWAAHLIPGAKQTPSGSSLVAVAQHLGFTYAKQ